MRNKLQNYLNKAILPETMEFEPKLNNSEEFFHCLLQISVLLMEEGNCFSSIYRLNLGPEIPEMIGKNRGDWFTGEEGLRESSLDSLLFVWLCLASFTIPPAFALLNYLS